MRSAILFLSMALFSISSYCQHTIIIQVKDASNSQPIQGASILIKNTGTGAATDSSGNVSLLIPAIDKITLVVSFIGYAERSINLKSPFPATLDILLEPEEEEEAPAVGLHQSFTTPPYAPPVRQEERT